MISPFFNAENMGSASPGRRSRLSQRPPRAGAFFVATGWRNHKKLRHEHHIFTEIQQKPWIVCFFKQLLMIYNHINDDIGIYI